MPFSPFWDIKTKIHFLILLSCWGMQTECLSNVLPGTITTMVWSHLEPKAFTISFLVYQISLSCECYFSWQLFHLSCVLIFICLRVCSVPLWVIPWQWYSSPLSFLLLWNSQVIKCFWKQLFHKYIQNLLQGSLLPWQPHYPVSA